MTDHEREEAEVQRLVRAIADVEVWDDSTVQSWIQRLATAGEYQMVQSLRHFTNEHPLVHQWLLEQKRARRYHWCQQQNIESRIAALEECPPEPI